MPRWEHGSEDRLKKAAQELFDEQGFEQTSVAEIARRARVTTRTFFRYFADKSEVLFAGSDALHEALIAKIFQVPDGLGPLQVVTKALAAFDWENLEPRRSQRARHAVITANPGLLERDLSKLHEITVGIAEALRQRGVDEETAQLAARIGVQVFFTAYKRWLETRDKADLATFTERAMSLLKTIVSAGSLPPAPRRTKLRATTNQPSQAARSSSVSSRSKGARRR